MMPPPRRLRTVPEPAPGDDRPETDGDPVGNDGALQAALAAIEGDPGAETAKDPSHDPGGTEGICDRPRDPGTPFLAMVERAGKVAPIRADTSRLTPGELLQMIGGIADAPDPDSTTAPGEAEAALGQLAAAAWSVIRTGAAEEDPELRDCLVEICTRLGGRDLASGRD